MEVNHLKKEMLQYELAVRGVETEEGKLVDDLRSALRSLLKMEKQGHPLNIIDYPFDPTTEIDTTAGMVEEISVLIKTFDRGTSKSNVDRTRTRLIHLLHRVDRIPADKLSPEGAKLRSSLLATILSNLDKLEALQIVDPELSILMEGARLHNEGVELTSTPNKSQPERSQTSTDNTAVASKFEPIYKCGLKFSGDHKQISVHAFLERVHELQKARHVSDQDLYDSAIDLFSGKALNWYRANTHRFSNWFELSELLRKHYEPPDYKSRLFREILDRTQGQTESIIDYLTAMSSLFRRYGEVPADAQLEIIMRNLSPFYTTQLPVVNTLEELERECLKLESRKYRADNYVPPSRRRGNLVEPDFAFVSSQVPSSSVQSINACDSNPSNQTASSLSCWNCHRQGHLSRNCRQPRKIHCFRCGRADVTTNNCPNCGSGNVSRGKRS